MSDDPFSQFSQGASFEAPIDMLEACHGRVQAQCKLLQRLAPYVADHGVDDDVRQAVGRVMRYFQTSAVHHHADEERDLFPAMREAAPAVDAQRLERLFDELSREHRQLERLWSDLRARLDALSQGDAQAFDAEQAEAFVTAYRAHITREEAELLPTAREILGADRLGRIGDAMRRRRAGG